MALLLLLPPPPDERGLVMGDASTGGDSGGEFNPALQVVLLSVRSPVTINFRVNLFSLVSRVNKESQKLKEGVVSN